MSEQYTQVCCKPSRKQLFSCHSLLDTTGTFVSIVPQQMLVVEELPICLAFSMHHAHVGTKSLDSAHKLVFGLLSVFTKHSEVALLMPSSVMCEPLKVKWVRWRILQLQQHIVEKIHGPPIGFSLAGQNGCKMIHIVYDTLLVICIEELSLASHHLQQWQHHGALLRLLSLLYHFWAHRMLWWHPQKSQTGMAFLVLYYWVAFPLGTPLCLYGSFQLWLFSPQGASLLLAQIWRGYHTQYFSHVDDKDQ